MNDDKDSTDLTELAEKVHDDLIDKYDDEVLFKVTCFLLLTRLRGLVTTYGYSINGAKKEFLKSLRKIIEEYAKAYSENKE